MFPNKVEIFLNMIIADKSEAINHAEQHFKQVLLLVKMEKELVEDYPVTSIWSVLPIESVLSEAKEIWSNPTEHQEIETLNNKGASTIIPKLFNLVVFC